MFLVFAIERSVVEPLAVALAAGLLIGLEREWSHRTRSGQAAGSRTFALVALAGALAARGDSWVVAGGLVAVSALAVAAYFRTSENEPGLTSEVALLVTYLLGVLAQADAAAATAVAVAVALLLVSKERLHRFARSIVTEQEIEDALKFLALAFIVLPLLPDRSAGPYGVLNPSRLWTYVVLLTGVGWVGYVAVRVLGGTRGLVVSGLAGGFVSGSLTTGAMARTSRTRPETAADGSALAGAVCASVSTVLQLTAILAAGSTDLLERMAVPLSATGFTLGVTALIIGWRSLRSGSGEGAKVEPADPPANPTRPFELRGAIVMAVVLTAAVLASRWMSDIAGTGGVMISSAATGLADAHAASLAAATLVARREIDLGFGVAAVGVALAANTVVKSGLAFVGGGRRFGARYVLAMLPALVVAAVSFAIAARW